MSETDQDKVAADGPGNWVRDQFERYRDLRGRIERNTLPLATSVDGSAFEFQASLHGLELKRGAYVVLEHEDGNRFGQITELDEQQRPGRRRVGSRRDDEHPRPPGGRQRVAPRPRRPLPRRARPPGTPDEVGAWLDGTRRRDRASLVIGELLLAPGVPAELDSGGFNRHTFMCGQSGSGKTYSLGLLLEKVLAETTLRIVILDPNSDYVGLGKVRDGADPARAQRHQAIGGDVAVWSNEPGADHPLKLRFAELDTAAQGAVLGLDPIADRDEYAVLSDLLRANDRGKPLITGLDQLIGSPTRAPSTWACGPPTWASSTGPSGDPGPSLLQELEEPTSRCTGRGPRVPATPSRSNGWSRTPCCGAVGLRATDSPCLVVIDEAHNICPPSPTTPLSRITTERAIQIAAEGRKYGLYLLVSTQRPNKVHENVVSQCDNLLLMRMNSDGRRGRPDPAVLLRATRA